MTRLTRDQAREYGRLARTLRADENADAFMRMHTTLVNAGCRPELRVQFVRESQSRPLGTLSIVVPGDLSELPTADNTSPGDRLSAVVCWYDMLYYSIVSLQRSDDRIMKLLRQFARHAQPPATADDIVKEPEFRRAIEL